MLATPPDPQPPPMKNPSAPNTLGAPLPGGGYGGYNGGQIGPAGAMNSGGGGGSGGSGQLTIIPLR